MLPIGVDLFGKKGCVQSLFPLLFMFCFFAVLNQLMQNTAHIEIGSSQREIIHCH